MCKLKSFIAYFLAHKPYHIKPHTDEQVPLTSLHSRVNWELWTPPFIIKPHLFTNNKGRTLTDVCPLVVGYLVLQFSGFRFCIKCHNLVEKKMPKFEKNLRQQEDHKQN